jgi:predicted dehydrogenase
MRNDTPNRREFLHCNAAMAGAAAAAAVIPGHFPNSQAVAATAKNDRPLVACIGAGRRGRGDVKEAARFGDIVAICDADLARADQMREALGGKADVYQDYRRVLERPDIDVVIHATPDHWHTAINIDACRAGKDIYAEKPLTLTIDEGKQLVRVVKETGRVVQVGTQQRSEKPFQTAVELVRNGRLGRLKQVWVAVPYFSTKGGPYVTEPVPDKLNWDLYQGQAPEHDYCHQRTHDIFRWWYDYAGGIVTDWGNHHIDIAHWGMDCETTGPRTIEARGIFPNQGKANCFNTPDRFFSRMVYPNGIELLYFAALNDRRIYGEVEENEPTSDEQIAQLFGEDVPEEIKSFDRNGTMFIGEKGRILVNRGGVYGKAVEELAENPLPEDAWRVKPSDDHMANFFSCVASRKEPVSPVRIQHRTVSACHLTNLSIRLERPLTWDPKAEQMVDDPEAGTWLRRAQRSPYEVKG